MVRIADRVNTIMVEHPETRDNDWLLILAYLCFYHGLKKEIGAIAYIALKKLIIDSGIPTGESITRARRKLQETYPTLRGLSYQKRHKVLEPEMRDWVNQDHL